VSKTAQMSIPKPRTVCGYEIRKMPLGAYLTAMEQLQDLPGDLLGICFPGLPPADILAQLAQFDAGMLQGVVSNVLIAAPKHAITVIAQLTGIPEDKLLSDPNIGLDGLAEIVDTWIEVNGLANFITAARTIAGKVKAAIVNYRQPAIGSNG
jgi:hypothetical protein